MKPQKTSVSYRIERKPEGRFIARSADPAIPAIEAPTQEELSPNWTHTGFQSTNGDTKIATASNHAPEGVLDANSPTLNGIATPASNAPNTPECNSSWKVFKVFMVLLALVADAAMYFFLYHR